MTTLNYLRSFRINNFAIIDFAGVILLAEFLLFNRKQRKQDVSIVQRLVYYLFSFILGLVMHDFFNVKTQIQI